MRGIRGILMAAATAAACATPRPASDTVDTLGAVDTIRPAVVAIPETAGASTSANGSPATAATAKPATSTRPKSSGTSTGTGAARDSALVARDTTHLGRDSVIRINPRDPSRKIPPVKPPR